MKKLMMVLVMVLGSVSLSGQNNVKNLTEWNLDTYAYQCLQDLKIDNVVIIIHQYNGLIYGVYPALVERSGNIYNITISGTNGYSGALKCLGHEIFHMSQYETGRLTNIDKKAIVFNGLKYEVSEKSHYDDPQEVEARNEGLRLFKQYAFILN